MSRLPPMPDGLTPEWMNGLLHEHDVLDENAQVTGVRRSQVGEGVGMMSELSRLHLSYTGDTQGAPASLIAKYPSQNPTNRAVAMSFNLYEREVRYFAELDPLTSAVCPEIVESRLDGDNFIILMQDMSDYRTGDQIVGATLDETEIALDEAAKLHAAFWGKVDGIDWIPAIAGSYHADNMLAGTQAGWPVMVATFGDFLPPNVAAMGERFHANLADLQARMNTPPVTLVHGDFRMENFLYGVQPDHHPMALLDWQGPLKGSGLVDVALLLAQSTQTEVRRKHERDLLRRYLDRLAALDVTAWSPDEVWEAYRYTVLYNWCYVAVVAGTLDPSNERGFAWMSQMVARQAAATDDLELERLIE